VVKARQEGLAALSLLRPTKTAALRNLANAAQMIERNASLMQLRALQVLGRQPGNTLVLGMSGGTPIPRRAAGAPVAPQETTLSEPPSDGGA